MRVAGLISGTSVDGIDVAVVDIDDQRLDVVAATTVPYAAAVRQAILGVTSAADVSRLNFLLGELFADAVKQLGIEVELIGSHGQTIFHEGEPVEYLGHRIASTLQIGEGAVIAERTGVPVVANFRTADMAAGGNGAPLAPYLDYRLFRHPDRARIALNIGGIANLTVVPARARLEDVVAFDIGPGNMVMDALCPPFDRGGIRASQGRVNQPLLEKLLADPYYSAAPPKSCGREQYGAEFIRATGIDLTTAAELTAGTIANAVANYPATTEVIVSGGGAHNTYLLERLRARIKPALLSSAELGVDADSKEAVLFALLAYETWHRRPGNVPSATGAKYQVVLGSLFEPRPRQAPIGEGRPGRN
jgi:anhydro-N-acetylmuramic acid kinase